MTLPIFADQDAESHARAPVTLIAQLVQADDFSFDIGLRSGGPDGTDAQSRVPRIPVAAKNDLVIIESSLFACSRPSNMNSMRNRSVL